MKQPNNLACHEIEIHYKRPVLESMPVLRHTSDTLSFIKSHINTNRIDYKECMWVILVSNNNSILAYSKVSEGGVNATVLPIREIVQLALKTHATGVVLVHNHPSGTLRTSDQDITQTTQCKKALQLIESNLLDHLIITSESYYSFMEHNLLSSP